MKRLFLTLIAFTALAAGRLLCKEQFIYNQISQAEGLTSTVNCIYKETNGDVWIGTPNGLFSFNGNTLKHYADSCLDGRKIFQTGRDMVGNFWILTDKGVICRKPGETLFSQKKAENADSDVQFYSMCHDKDGIWFGGFGKIFRYTHHDECLRLFCDMVSRPSFICRSINILDGQRLMCCSHNGIISVDTVTGEISNLPYGRYKEVSSSLIDSKGRIWLAFYNHGIEVFHKDGTLLKRYNTGNSSLSNDVVLCMTERDTSIWVGTDGGGINIINPEDDTITVLAHISGDPSSFPAHSIKSIYTDHYGNIWAGSIRDGLIEISNSGMKTYRDIHIGLKHGLSNPTVLCLYQEEKSDEVWIGTDGEGINRFDPETNEFTHYPKTLKSKVVSIASYSENELVLSLYADKICLFDKRTGHIRPLKINDNDLNYQIRYAGRSINLFNEKDGNLLLIGNTVNRMDKATGKCVRISTQDNTKASGNYLTVGTTDEGLWLHDMHSVYLLDDGGNFLHKKGSIGKKTIKSGHLGTDGTIWFATDDGVYRYGMENSSFTKISTDLFTKASSIVCDRQSRIWIGTSNRLYAYLLESGSFALFGNSDGASPNEYLSKARLLSGNGDIYMGGVQGLTCINSSYEIETEEPAIKLYGLSIDNEEVHPADNGFHEAPRNSKTINISVSVQEKDIFREKRFRFRISENEIYETGSPVLSVQPVPRPGTYDILASCSKRNGEWSVPVKVMTLKIPQPWYLTWWSISIMTLCILLAASLTYLSIMHRKANRMKLALKEREQVIYEEKVRMLINISHELRTPLTLIMAPLKRLITGMSGNEENFNTLNRIYRQSRRMRDLLNMVLDLRKMEVGKSRIQPEKLEFNRWIEESIEDIRNEENEEGIYIRTELDPAVGSVVFDRRMCDTILTNILINAIKHSKKGDTITIRTSLKDNDMVRVSISDEGQGLGDIDMSRMFTRFYQSNSEKYGSGIGLSYSRILVEMHGGKIGAENNETVGATFWWEIPANGFSEDMQPIQGKAYLNELLGQDIEADMAGIPERETFNTSSMTVMLVDDNQDLLDFLKESLSSDFSEIMLATSGNKAMKMLQSGRLPDIIVSDVNMPDGDGFKLCHDIKENEQLRHIPLILLTARGEEQSQSDSYRMGADAFLAKPFEIETLVEMLKNMLRRKTEIRKQYLDTRSEDTAAYGSEEEGFILKLNRIIAEHISDPELDQQLICHELGISRAALYNKMKAITGNGTKEYITRIRIEKAKSLIDNTQLSFTDIADMTGFTSLSYFSTAFKNSTGVTPSQYKKQTSK